MLKKALQRIKVPINFITLIENLFLNRKNQVFTGVGITNEYDVLIGIDQGEIISPILWCIYYDPLLCEIEKSGLGYKLEEKYKKNIYDRLYQEDTFMIGSIAFMDDTQWLTDSKNKLERILNIADSFYTLNDIQVNKDKSELVI